MNGVARFGSEPTILDIGLDAERFELAFACQRLKQQFAFLSRTFIDDLAASHLCRVDRGCVILFDRLRDADPNGVGQRDLSKGG
jgi:hypothetical protein